MTCNDDEVLLMRSLLLQVNDEFYSAVLPSQRSLTEGCRDDLSGCRSAPVSLNNNNIISYNIHIHPAPITRLAVDIAYTQISRALK